MPSPGAASWLTLPDSDGVGTYDRVRELVPELPIVIFTGDGDTHHALELIHRGAQDYLVKGELDEDRLGRCLAYAIDLRELVEESVEVFAHRKGLSIACELAPDLLPQAPGDATRIRQTLLNLTGNAVKFTESGRVLLRVHRLGADPERLAGRDFERLQTVGHNLKGSAAPYGFPQIGRLGAVLEAAAKPGDLGAAASAVEELARRVEQADAAVSREATS